MSFLDEYNALKKKRKENLPDGSFLDEYNEIKAQRVNSADGDIAPVKTTVKKENEEKKGLFDGITAPLDDGWDQGDITSIAMEGLDRILSGHPENRGKVTDADGDGLREASWLDATVNSAKRGYYNSLYGEETYHAMLGEKNSADVYRKILEGDEFQFEAEGWAKKAVSGAAEMLGQIARQSTREETLMAGVAGAGAGAGMALVAGQAGPQVLLPEEALTVPGGAIAGFTTGLTAGNAAAALEIEAGHAYNEMIENGISEKTAKNIALAVGGVNAGLELLQVDELFKAFKVLNKTGATDTVVKRIAQELLARGFDVAKETAQEVAQEGVTITGTQVASKIDTGEWAYAKEDVASRLGETAMSSALTFGTMNVPAGVSNVSQIASDNSSAQKLTVNEQKVVDKEVENRIAEKEKDGKKLTNKEKATIEEAVIRDMERGYISTDTIEEVLGGETYKTHKETMESEKAMQEEYDALYQMKNGDKSDAQIDRQAELKQKLEDIKQNFNRNQLGEEVFSMVKGDRLAESYNERSRRGQAFEADVTKYDAKMQPTIQKAIDSGILNNTNRTHEFVDMIAKITADKGVLFDFTNNERLRESGFALNGKTVNGYVTKDGITLNIDSAKALNSVVGHEVTHVLEGTEMYTDLQSVVAEYAKTKGEYQSRYDSLAKLYEGIEGADIGAELTADLVGDYLFTDAEFVKNLSVNHRNAFQKIFDEIKYLCKVATAGSDVARELEKLKKAFEDAYRTGSKAQSDTKYSLENGNKRHYNKRSRYSETETLFLSWENGSAPVGEVKRFVRFGKVRYYEKTDSGCVELSKSQYNERRGLYVENFDGRAEREIGETADYDGSSQRGTIGYPDSNRYTGGNASVFGQTVREELQNDTGRSTSGTLGYDSGNDIKQSEYNEEASDGSDASFTFSNDYATIRNYMKEGDTNSAADVAPVKYSLTDNEGVTLSSEQQEYFKNSVVRDENGRLKRMYHGTANGGFTVFDTYGSNHGLFGQGSYFTDNPEVGLSYIDKGKTKPGKTPDLYEVYLNITKPMDMDAPADVEAWREAVPDADFPTSGTNEQFYRAMEQYLEDEMYEKWEAASYAVETIQGMGFDGITHIGGGRYNKKDTNRHRVYIAFEPEQIKKFNNTKPTENPDIRYSLSDIGETPDNHGLAPLNKYKYSDTYGKDIALETAPVREDIAENATEDIAPVANTKAEDPGKTVQNTRKELSTKINNLQTELDNNQRLREQSNADFEAEIAQLQAEYNGLTNKNTKKANDLLRRIERRQRMKNNVDADYANRIANLEQRIEKMSSDTYQTAAQRKAKQQEYSEQMESLVGDTTHWKDKKLGVFYKVNTLRRNLRDVVRKADGSRDIEKADAIYDELQGKYNHNEAILNREASQIKQPYADMKITKAEDAYIQMLGELRHNPDTTLTEDVVNEFYEKHKGNIDKAKVDRAIEMARKTYDELLIRVNEVLREQGMKEIPYRKGYFPHFTEDKQSFLAKLFNWKTHNNDIPTDIAGLTENFNPNRSWQSFNKERKSDTTDYSFMRGMDTYVQGALDWVHHIEDIQKRRAFENYLRYIHSEQGVKDKIEAIKKNEEYDADEMQKQIDLVYEEARNPLNNFVVDLRAGTNTLANKKSSMDRGLEDATNRKFYSTMTNISSRVSANMVGGSISSALTNFIPITQSWGQVSPVSSLRAMADTIRSTFRDDGTINKSDFLTNRLRPADKLYKSGWDKVSNTVGLLMEGIDSFTSQTVWRSKYLENISDGMSESEAIKNADQFAENVLAGRSRGNQPTIFDSKNPLVKTLTAFQLEVANQYGYMLKDMPQDMRNETKAKLVKGYATMFLGAYAYNALFSSLTGRDAAFDPIGIIEDLLRDLGLFGDDEEEEEIAPVDVVMNLTENILQEVPFVGGLMGGGRVPISSALPYDGNVMDIMEGAGKLFLEGDTSDLTSEWLKPVYYVASPVGGGQIKKTVEGLSMFSNDHPIAGSYTKSGDLRFPVDDTLGSRVKAGLFGQWSSKNARHYFDNDIAPLDEKRVQEYTDLGLSYEEYWAYRDDMSAISKRAEEDGASKEDVVKSKYIDSVNSELSAIQAEKDKVMEDTKLSAKEKEARIGDLDKQFADLAKERHRSYNDVSFDGDFANIGSHYYQWYTPEKGEAYWRKLDEAQVAKYQAIRNVGANAHYATNGTTHYRLEEGGNPKNFSDWTKISDKDLARQREVTRELGITSEEYWSKTETSFIPMKSGEYEYAYENPGNYGVAKVVGGYEDYTGFMKAIGEFDSKNANGETVSGLKKERVTAYINGLDLDYGQKIILYRSQYDSKADRAAYDADIFEYLNGRDDISYEEKVAIFKKLGFSVSDDGYVTW